MADGPQPEETQAFDLVGMCASVSLMYLLPFSVELPLYMRV